LSTASIVERTQLLEESLAEGFQFLARLRSDWHAGANRFGGAGEAFFTARRQGSLVGVCGLNVDPYAGDPAIGRLRRLYVTIRSRRHGVGRALVSAALAHARPHFTRVPRTNWCCLVCRLPESQDGGMTG
jgi:GNAT superfamily N-acetyltransferase